MTALYPQFLSRFPADRSRAFLIEPGGRTWTYQDLHARTGALASSLLAQGLRPGDRLAAQVEKSVEGLFLYLACLRAGLVYLPMNTAYRPEEVDYLLGDAEPAAWVLGPEREAAGRDLAAARGVRHVWTLDARGRGSLAELSEAGERDLPGVAPEDLAVMLYTSGTTGRPKGAMLTHRNLATNGTAVASAWRFGPDDVLLHALPIFHVHGLFVATHCALLSGSCLRWLPRFEAETAIAELDRSTVFMGVPTYYHRMLAHPALSRAACRNVRLFVSGSAPLLAETHARFEALTGAVILERYGMTETGMIAGNPHDGPRRAGTVGVPFAGVEVRVAGEPEAAGEIQVRGPNVMAGYWRDPERTAAEFVDGWFKTGDLGRWTAQRYLQIVGRAKDMIVSGGYNVYPKEIEVLLDAIPGIDESAVFGVPHPDFGEVGVAVVLRPGMAPGEPEILARLREQLAGYKVPKRVFVVEDLPRNTMGKVQKNLLREQYRALFAAP